jgi:transposase InsO family protein
MVAQEFIDMGEPIRLVLKYCQVPVSSYYYKPRVGRQGRKPYATYLDSTGNLAREQDIVLSINKLFENPFVDYGYLKTWIYLKNELGYSVSRDAIYKLMKKHNLLNLSRKEKVKKGIRNKAEAMVPQPVTEFSYWEFDIKFVWIQGKRRNAQVLTILDVFSRWNMGQYIAFDIKQEHVVKLFQRVSTSFKLPAKFVVRNDNGSQFVAQSVQDYLLTIGAAQEFTKPATPQMNAHIESYHSIMESSVCQRFEFNDLVEFRETMEDFQKFYNFERIHSGVGFTSPYKFLLKKGVDMKQPPP